MNSLIVQNADGSETITVYGLGQLKIANSDHPNYNQIRSIVVDHIQEGYEPDLEEFEALFDVSTTIVHAFQRLSESVAVRGDTIYFDQDPIHDTLAEQILRYLDEGEDFGPLVNFMEKIADNPSENSREALYRWLQVRNFTLTPDGNFIGYKGVKRAAAPTTGPHRDIPASGFGGHAFVDGVEYGADRASTIPYPIGAIVEMPRSECSDDSMYECSTGLHVGTFEYASGYAEDCKVLEVEINPRDVVSVPSSTTSFKIRVCRLTVVRELDEGYTQPVVWRDLSRDFDVESDPEPVLNFGYQLVELHATYLKRAQKRRQPVVRYIEHMSAREGTPLKYSGTGDPKQYDSWTLEIT